MIPTEEREKWLDILKERELVNLMRQKSREQDVWLDTLASVAAWATPILDRISNFFPLYTPHNYTLHISTVIDSLDWLMPKTLKQEIEAHELFCLLAACLTHDIGMAVSREEIKEISSDADFQKFKANLENEFQEEIDADNLKRLWMRNTHHERSAAKVSDFFDKLGDSGLGLAISMIVKGHCMDIEQILEDKNSFPSQFPIGSNRRVNIPALVSYLRLADIFDCTRSRTPWVLYNFIDPDDKISREEWEGHLATLAISPDEEREHIIGSAKTDDKDVFLHLCRYERIVRNELQTCRQILSSQPDRYSLDLRTFDLSITTEGFEPVEWLFTINREAALELLMGNSLYSDPTTCIRELLQNSVDACRQRALLESKYEPEIHISLFSNAKGLYLECKDNGIGMTSELVEKFLLKVGQRYYESQFYKSLYPQQKRIEPTAKFGIGFLSCFMLGDDVSIQSQSEQEPPFSLEFRGLTGHIIKKRIPSNTAQGTTVKIKIARILDANFDLVACAKKFVGLLEFPILVYDTHHPNGVKIKRSDKPLERRGFFAVFDPSCDAGLSGYVQIVAEKTSPPTIISQLGFRIPIDHLLPSWAKKFSQLIDLSGGSKIGLTTSREKIIDLSKLSDVKIIVSKKIRDAFFEKFARSTPTIKNLRESWVILRNHITPSIFVELEDTKALEDLLLSLYIAGFKEGKHCFINLNEIKLKKSTLRILPTRVNPPQDTMSKLAIKDNLFICAGAEFGYDRWMHDGLKAFLDATGMPVWISSEKTHAWEYKPQQPNYGWYSKGKEITGTHTVDVDSYNVDFDVSAPDLYLGHCNSPFILLKCPFNPDGLFFNTTSFAYDLPISKKAEADDIADMLVKDVVKEVIKNVYADVEGDLDLPPFGFGDSSYEEQVVDIDTILEAFSEYLGEMNIELLDSLIDPNLKKD